MTTADLVFGIVGVVIALLLLSTAGWDIYAFRNGGIPTVSEWLLAASRQEPLVAALVGCLFGLLAGVLIGHLFWPQVPR